MLMNSKETASSFDVLMQQLALVNARLQGTPKNHEAVYLEREEIMELIARDRLGQARQLVWKSGQPSAA